jgi:hypothetical protein
MEYLEYIRAYNEIVCLLGVEWYPVKKKLEGPDAVSVLDQFADYAEAVVMMRQVTVPVLSQDPTCSDHMNWLMASRKHSAYAELAQLRLKRLESLL